MALQPITELFERGAELARIEAFVADTAAGRGRAIVIEGPPGIGKSELLRCTADRAGARDVRVLRARAGEFERGLSFGVAHQLFDRILLSASGDEREIMLAGPARIAAGLLERAQTAEVDEGALLNALYWLLQNIATGAPALAVVDDAHWTDTESLRWIAHTARRLADTPVGIALAARRLQEEDAGRLLDAIATDPEVEVLQPAPLSPGAVASLVRADLDASAEADFCRACWGATRGNPFYCRGLIDAVKRDQIAPTDKSAGRVRDLSPEAITRSVATRIGGLRPGARGLARAVAVLGQGATLHLTAALAALSHDEASDAADDLAAASILATAGDGVEFVHPIVRTVVYGDMSSGERSKGHAAAAHLLADQGASPERVALHLVAAEPRGETWTVSALREAAAAATSPEAEAVFLRRALAEPPQPAERPGVLASLGTAEAKAMDASALDHLRAARDATDDPITGARIALSAAEALTWVGRLDEVAATCKTALGELAARDEYPAARELELMLRCYLMIGSPREHPLEEPLEELWERFVHPSTPGEHALLARLAYGACFTGSADVEQTRKAARQTLTSPHLAPGAVPPGVRYLPIWALEFCDCLTEAEHALMEDLTRASDAASPSQLAWARTFLAIVAFKRGQLLEALTHAEIADELVAEHELTGLVPTASAILAMTLTERGELAAADAALEPKNERRSHTTPSSEALLPLAHGRLTVARREWSSALDFLHEAGELMAADGHDHPAYYAWRSQAALARIRLGDVAAANALAREELEMARAFGAPVSVGRALRVCGIAEQSETLLRDAVDVLDGTEGQLELAYAVAELGAALRRSQRRREARDFLTRALQLADDCGALMLAEHAREELASIGVRPPREAVAGIDALTPSEARIARMAAEGMTNREIARTLYLSVKTIEKHLGQAYLKLEVGSRRDLPAALER